MVKGISCQKFKDTGMLWRINMILYTFRLGIVLDVEDGEIKEMYHVRVKYRGFKKRIIQKDILR